MAQKGFILDIGFYAIMLFIFALSLLTAYMVYSGFNDELRDSGFNTTASETVNNGMGIMDSAYAFLFFGMILALFISVFLVNTHPVFFVIIVIIWVFLIFFGVVFANTYEMFATETMVVPFTADFPMMSSIMSNLPKIITVIGGLMIILLLGKRRMSGNV